MSPSHPISPSLPVETMWLGSSCLMSFAVRATQAKKRSLLSSEKARGSLAICQEKMAGSSR